MKNTKKLNYHALITGTSAAIVSAYLTYVFMYNLGLSVGLPIAMGMVGLVLESGKYLFSREVAMAPSRMKSALFCTATVCLMVISMFASISAIEMGVNDAKSQTDAYKLITSQIERIEINIKKDIENGYRTRAIQNEDKITTLRMMLSDIPANSFVTAYSKTISITIAVALEFVGVIAVTLVTGTVQNNTEQFRTTQNNPEQYDDLCVGSELADVKSEVGEQIRCAILNRSIERPSVACVREHFSGIASEKISAILKALGEEGYLKPRGKNGWKYV